jgi:drug/metabolite transporter (DMT)-like permease
VDRPTLGFAGRLARRGTFVTALVLSAAGFGLQVLALHHAPLAVVQPVLALGLLALLALARVVLGERPGRRELTGVLLVAGAAAGTVALAGHAQHGTPAAGPVIVALLAAAALAPLVRAVPRAGLLVVAAGCGDVAVALGGARLAHAGSAAAAVAWMVAVAGGGIGSLVSESAALQRLPAVRVGPSLLAAQVAVPVVLAGAVAGQRLGDTTPATAGLLACLAVLAGGVVLLASSPLVAGVMHPDAHAPGRPG